MNRYTIEIDGVEYRVEVLEDRGNDARVLVNDRELRLSVRAEANPVAELAPTPRPAAHPQPRVAPRPPAAATLRSAAGEVRAPMPARVTDIVVKIGDVVEEGQLLLKIEAMKMENHVLSPVAGTVEELCVSNGQEVAEGDLLAKIAPS